MSKVETDRNEYLKRIADAVEKNNEIMEVLCNLVAILLTDSGVETEEGERKKAGTEHLPEMYKNLEKNS